MTCDLLVILLHQGTYNYKHDEVVKTGDFVAAAYLTFNFLAGRRPRAVVIHNFYFRVLFTCTENEPNIAHEIKKIKPDCAG